MSKHNPDSMTGVGLAFMLIIIAAYFLVFYCNYKNLRPETLRLSVLNTRVGFFLSFYAIMMFISLNAPNALPALNVFITIMEGYSFYSFFTMIVTNLGGPAATVAYFKETARPLVCCNPCCPSEPEAYYRKTTWALWHFLFTRTVIVILSAIAFYSGSKAGHVVSALLSLVAAGLLVYSLLHLVLLYENLYQFNKNLFGIMKMAMLKFSVGLIVLQGLIETFMVATSTEPYDDDSNWDAEDKTIRGYCLLVLIEFVILCIPFTYAFTKKIEDPPKPLESAGTVVTADMSVCAFACKVMNVLDVFGVLTLTDAMTEPLAGNKA